MVLFSWPKLCPLIMCPHLCLRWMAASQFHICCSANRFPTLPSNALQFFFPVHAAAWYMAHVALWMPIPHACPARKATKPAPSDTPSSFVRSPRTVQTATLFIGIFRTYWTHTTLLTHILLFFGLLLLQSLHICILILNLHSCLLC